MGIFYNLSTSFNEAGFDNGHAGGPLDKFGTLCYTGSVRSKQCPFPTRRNQCFTSSLTKPPLNRIRR